jgi:hypothetical protein
MLTAIIDSAPSCTHGSPLNRNVRQTLKAPGGIQASRPISLRRRAALALLWPVCTVVMGWIAASIGGGGASVIVLIVGIYVGIAGAVSYVLLPFCASFRSLGRPGRLAVSTTAAALPPIAFLGYSVFSLPTQPGLPAAHASFFYMVAGTATVLACIGTVLVTYVESRWSA